MATSHRTRPVASTPRKSAGTAYGTGQSPRLAHALALTALAAFVVFHYRDYLSGTQFIKDDALRWYYPVVNNFCEAMSSGRFPFWCDAIQCGIPLYTDVQAAFYYPPLWLLIPFVGAHGLPFLAYQWYIVLHVLLGGGFMYLLLFRHNLGALPCLLGAIVFCFAGFPSLHVIHVPMLHVYTWLPLQAALVEKCVETRRLRHYALLALILLLALLGGFPQILLYNCLFLSAYWLYRAHRSATGQPPKQFRAFRNEVLRMIGVFGTVLLLAAIQILPAIEHWDLSQREKWGFSRISDQSLPWHMLIHLLVPNFFGMFDGGQNGLFFWGCDLSVHEAAIYGCAPWQYHEFGAYAGQLACVAFAGLALEWKRLRGHVAPFFACAALCALWFMLGRYGGLFQLLYHVVPGVALFRGPSRMACVFDFAAAAMAAFAVHRWTTQADTRPARAFGAVLAVYFAGLWWYAESAKALFPILREPQLGELASSEALASMLFLGGIAACIWLVRRHPQALSRAAAGTVLAILVFADLHHAYGHFHRGSANPAIFFNPSPAVLQVIRDHAAAYGPMRFVQTSTGARSEYLWDQNASLMHEELESPRGLSTFVLRKYQKFQNIPRDEVKLDIQNVRMCSTLDVQKNEASLLVRTSCLERAEFFTRFKIYDSDEQALHDLGTGAIDHHKTLAVLRSEFGEPPVPPAFDPSHPTHPVNVERISPEHTRITFNTGQPGIVFLSRSFYPGWQATDSSGRHYPIIRAFVAFTGIVVPSAGSAQIDLRFRPTSFRTGAAITIATALSLLGLAVLLRSRRNNAPLGIH